MSLGMSAFTGMATPARFFDRKRPSVGSCWLCSIAAMPQPQMMPPVICALAVRGLMIRPTL